MPKGRYLFISFLRTKSQTGQMKNRSSEKSHKKRLRAINNQRFNTCVIDFRILFQKHSTDLIKEITSTPLRVAKRQRTNTRQIFSIVKEDSNDTIQILWDFFKKPVECQYYSSSSKKL